MNYDVIGIGNALVDIQTQVTEEGLNKLNYTKGGMALSSPKEQERILEALEAYTHSPSICSGGSAANTIHGIGALSGRAYYIGRVANDGYGRHYTQDMADCGVGFPGPGAEDSGTGTSLVLITPDAQRTMVTNLGISAALHSDNVDDTIVAGAKFVYIEGYLWTGEDTKQAAMKLARTARKAGVPVAFTLSDAFIVDNFKQDLLDFIKWDVDILFCNEVEGLALADEEDAGKAFDTIAAMCEHLFFTRGQEGAWACHRGGERLTVEGYQVDAIDTTGAGDLFAAGVLTGMIHKKPLRECVILGNYCAGQVVTHLGARMPAHSHTNINKIISDYPKEANKDS